MMQREVLKRFTEGGEMNKIALNQQPLVEGMQKSDQFWLHKKGKRGQPLCRTKLISYTGGS